MSRSDLSIPGGAAKIMSIYLLLAIGFKGGSAALFCFGSSDLGQVTGPLLGRFCRGEHELGQIGP